VAGGGARPREHVVFVPDLLTRLDGGSAAREAREDHASHHTNTREVVGYPIDARRVAKRKSRPDKSATSWNLQKTSGTHMRIDVLHEGDLHGYRFASCGDRIATHVPTPAALAQGKYAGIQFSYSGGNHAFFNSNTGAFGSMATLATSATTTKSTNLVGITTVKGMGPGAQAPGPSLSVAS